MALERGPAFYPKPRTRTTAGETPAVGAGEYDLDETADAGATVTLTGSSGLGAATKYFQVFPQGTGTLGSGSISSAVYQGNGKGWIIPATSVMGSISDALRVIRAGSWCNFSASGKATGLSGNCTLSYFIARRSATGTYTYTGIGAGVNVANGLTGTTYTRAFANVQMPTDLVFAAGETVYIEMAVTVPGQTLTAGTIVVNLAGTTAWVFGADASGGTTGDGICYAYSRSTSESVTGTDAVTQNSSHPRTITDSYPTTEVTTRAVITARTTTDSVTGSDAVTQNSNHPRTTTDSLTTSETVSRIAAHPRTVTDTLSTSDTVSRAFTGSRATTDSSTVTDVVSRLIIYGRFTYEYPAGVTPDFQVVFPTRKIAGFIRNPDGTVYRGGATVFLIRDSDGKTVQSTTSSTIDGSYSFARDLYDPFTYHVEAFTTVSGTPEQGVTQEGLSPV